LEVLGQDAAAGIKQTKVRTTLKDIKFLDIVDWPIFKVLSFDLETTSSTGKFPSGKVREDRIIQIGMSFSNKKKYLLNLGPLS